MAVGGKGARVTPFVTLLNKMHPAHGAACAHGVGTPGDSTWEDPNVSIGTSIGAGRVGVPLELISLFNEAVKILGGAIAKPPALCTLSL